MTNESEKSEPEGQLPKPAAVTPARGLPWHYSISDDVFEGYARHDDDAFVRLLENPILPFLRARVRSRWPGICGADRDEAVAQALGALWIWWRRRSSTKPRTPVQLLGYVATALDHAAARIGRAHTPRSHQDLPPASALQPDPLDGIEWLCATLHAWVTNPPAAASRPMRCLICDSTLVAFVRRAGSLPRVADLILTFGLRPRSARRRHAELAKLIRQAAADFDGT
jgi:hypothetical protein